MARPKGSKSKKNIDKVVIKDNVEVPELPPGKIEEVKEAKIKKVKENPKLAVARKLANEINKKFGAGTVKLASEEAPRERIFTGNDHINKFTGGIPCGSFTIFWGGSSCGKTTEILDIIAEAQKNEKICGLIDAEHSFDPVWAKKRGVDLEKLLLFKEFRTAEDALDTFVNIMENKALDLLVIDSISALSPKEEQETKKGKELSLEADQMASMAKKLSKFFKISTNKVYKAKCAVILVAQTRTNIGGFMAFEQLSGGHALKHYPVMILSFRRGSKADAPVKKVYNSKTKENENVPIGFSSVIKMDKTKISDTATEGDELDIPFYFETGFAK